MNNKEVYINGILIDLDERDNPIQLTYAVNDLAELKDRQAYSTNTFKIPRTANNEYACGLPNDPSLIQLQPYRKNTARVLQSGIEVLQNGIAIIRSSGAAIEVQILSGLIGFFDLLGDKKISDLDLSDLEHTWNLQTVLGSQTRSEGYIYPVIDYGSLSDDLREADARRLRPATFRHTLIERIISEAGYTAAGSYQNNSKYLNSIIPFTKDKFEHGKRFIDNTDTISASARKTSRQELSNDYREFDITFQDDATTDPGNHWDGTYYTATAVSKVSVTLKYNFGIRDQHKGGSTPSVLLSIQVFRGGNWLNAAEANYQAQGEFETHVYENQVMETEIDLSTGELIRVHAHSEPAVNRVQGIVYEGASVAIAYIATDVVYGQSVQLEATLPEVSQKNFFKDFLQNFGLIVIPDNYSKKLLLINMEDVYAQKQNAQDITDKLISSDDGITFSLNGYGINNNATYKKDDSVPSSLGGGTIVLDNLTLEENKDLFESIFAATVKVNKMGGLNVSQILKIEDKATGDFKLKTEPRILLDKKVESAFEFYDGNSRAAAPYISLPVFDGLEYQTLFEENYPEIKRMLYRPYVVVKKILLKEIDIKQITDWTVPVYDRKTASYYYKNQINYLQGDVSTISLIRLP